MRESDTEDELNNPNSEKKKMQMRNNNRRSFSQRQKFGTYWAEKLGIETKPDFFFFFFKIRLQGPN